MAVCKCGHDQAVHVEGYCRECECQWISFPVKQSVHQEVFGRELMLGAPRGFRHDDPEVDAYLAQSLQVFAGGQGNCLSPERTWQLAQELAAEMLKETAGEDALGTWKNGRMQESEVYRDFQVAVLKKLCGV